MAKSDFIQNGGLEDFTLFSGFSNGYRSREDRTILPPCVLIPGSQNVLTNTFQRLGNRKGYTLDGEANATISGIKSSYDWDMRAGERNLKYVEPTTSGGTDGKLQYRYVDSAGAVTWRDLVTGMSATTVNFSPFWDFTTEKKDFLLWVEGLSQITEWSGGIATVGSTTATTIVVAGTQTIPQLNFYNAAPFGSVVINGTSYAYTGVSGSTFTGVTPSPAAVLAGSVIHQLPKTTLNSAMTNIPSTFPNAIIATLRNQVYIGALTDNTIYVSKTNNYKDYSFTTPVRVVGEGALVTLDANAVGFSPQEDKMYITAGKDQWYETKFTLSADLSDESFEIIRLKTTSREAAQSQGLMGKMDNDIIFVSNMPKINSLGRVDNVVLTPQFTDISYPISNDVDSYDFTGGHIKFFREYIYVSVPTAGKVLIYNMTNPANPYWEAPQTLPVGRFAVIGGELYGHSFSTPETYKLFSGYNDNGAPIQAKAVMSFMNYGTRSAVKGMNLWYSEGYLKANTTLTMAIKFEVDGCQTMQTYELEGTNTQFVCRLSEDNSLGKNSFGKQPLGGVIGSGLTDTTPPKFRWIKSFPVKYFYEQTVEYGSYGVDFQWEILAFGGQIVSAQDQNVSITD